MAGTSPALEQVEHRNGGPLRQSRPGKTSTEQTERELPRNTYSVALDGGRLVWVTEAGGKEVRYSSEPEAGLMKRAKSTVIGWLPIEWLL